MMRAVFQVVAPINRLLDTVPFNLHCYSLDWHPSDHVSFIDNIQLRKLCPGTGKPELYGTVTFEARRKAAVNLPDRSL